MNTGTVNTGTVPMFMGAMITTVTKSTAIKCGLLAGGTIEGSNALDEQVSVSSSMMKTFNIGNSVFENYPCMIIPDNMLEFEDGKINGTVGWEVISELKWEIDFKNQKVAITAPTHEDVIRNMACNFFPMVTVGVNNKQMTLCLDTGANTTRFGAVLSGYFSEYEESTMETHAAGSERYERVRVIPEVHFSVGERAVKLRKMRLTVDNECSKSKFFITPGIIGSDIAKDSIMTIDWFNRRFSITGS